MFRRINQLAYLQAIMTIEGEKETKKYIINVIIKKLYHYFPALN